MSSAGFLKQPGVSAGQLSLGESPGEPAAPETGSEQSLNTLLKQSGLWRASRIDCDFRRNRQTGFDRLDAELPGAGWPSDGVTELLPSHQGIGEFRLLTPALAELSREQTRWLLLVSPPYIPYPPALAQAGIDLTRVIISQPSTQKDYLWVLEKALASQSCSAVMAWPTDIQEKQVRRLQVASKEGNCWGILFRPERAAVNASPAELRIRLRPPNRATDNSAVSLKIIKRRGRWESDDILINFDDQLQRPMPDFSEMVIRSRKPEAQPSLLTDDVPQYKPARYEYQ